MPAAIHRPSTSRPISAHTSDILDATRAVAAGLVVLFHAKNVALGVVLPVDPLDQVLYAITNCGTPAVFWFFVLSGYLVGGSVLAEVKAGRFRFDRYLIGRMARLYIVLLPALALGAALDGARVAAWGFNAHAGFESPASLTWIAFVGNLAFLQTLLVPTFGSNYALWSIASEFWFYLMLPLLLAPLMIGRSRSARAALCGSGLLMLLFVVHQNHSIAWQFVIWGFGAACRFVPPLHVRVEGPAWIGAVAGLVAFPYLHPVIGPMATAVTAATLGFALVAGHGRMGRDAFWAPWARTFAGFSFSLYLIHLPLLHLLAAMVSRSGDPFLYLPPRSLAAPTTILVLVVVAYVVAFGFSRLTEAHTDAVRRCLQKALTHPTPAGATLEGARSN